MMAAAGLCWIAVAAQAAGVAIPDFTFAHCSDDHVGAAEAVLSKTTIAEFRDLHPILLEPYNVTSLPISFIIDTGDVTEFGGHASWEKYLSYFEGVSVPLYICVGNHDATWRSLTYEVRQLFGSPYYSFDKFGCHFVMLDSAGLQHPLPSIGPEQLVWLKKDLEKVGRDAPVFVCLHHPLYTTEFASRYEVDRLLDVLRPYNVIAILYGHGHNAIHGVYEGIDTVQGGSTWGPGPAGYQIDCVKDGVLYIAYKLQGQPNATKAMLQKPLAPPAKRYPAITIAAPREGATYGAQISVKAWIALGKGEVKNAFLEIDGENKTDVALKPGGSFECSVPLASLSPGAHYMKLSFTGQDDKVYTRSTFFYKESTLPKVHWRVLMDTASKTTPSVGDANVYIGGYDGTVRAYNANSGKLRWVCTTCGAVTGQILLLGDKVYAGSEDKKLYCLAADNGKPLWQFEAEEPIYSSPVTYGISIYFGCGSGAFYSVDAKTGAQNWKNSDATYNIEIKPFVANGRVYYGAWDRYVYCVNTADGKLVWKCEGKGSSEGGAAVYYSPADCGPVVCNGMVFVADRKYRCAIIDDATGKIVNSLDGISGVGLSGDGQSVYLRHTNGSVSKVDCTGKDIWSASVPTDIVPTAPTESGSVVYACGGRGTLSAMSAADGKVLWQYDTTPTQYVLASVGAADSTAYVVGTDGSLTAVGD
jgi:outer membrane protein assembly factor BamB